MNRSVGIGGAVGGKQQLAACKIRRVHGRKLDLAGPLRQLRRALLRGLRRVLRLLHLPDSCAGAAAVCRLMRLCCLNRCLVIGRGFTLDEGNCVHRTCRQAVAEPVAVVVAHQLCFSVYDGNGALMAGGCARAAAIAESFVDLDDSSFHQNHSVSFVLASV